MDKSRRVIEYVCDIAHNVQTTDGYISASQMLERFLFSANMHSIPIGRLSGGEQRRLYLLGILMKAPNVLLLDEPTNDLDIETLCILENYLDTFAGAVITVSHDRHFIDRIAQHTFVYENNGHIGHYPGGYTDWTETRAALDEEQEQKNSVKNTADNSKNNSENKKDDARNSRPKKLKFSFNEQTEYETIDDDIAELEDRIAEIESEINKSGSNYSKLQELTEKQQQLSDELDHKMERWVYLNDLAEQIERQKNQAR